MSTIISKEKKKSSLVTNKSYSHLDQVSGSFTLCKITPSHCSNPGWSKLSCADQKLYQASTYDQ